MNIIWFTWKDLDNPLAGGAEVVNEELAARLAADGHNVTFLTSGFQGAAESASRRGFNIIRTGKRFTTYLTSARYYLKHRAELAPDLVIDECNTMPYFAGRYSGVRTVMFFHMLCREIWFYEFPWPLATIGWVLEPIYLRLLEPKDEVITVSESTRRDLIRHGFRSSKISIISEATHLAGITDLAAGTKFPEPTMLAHGSVRPMKRTLDQVKAFEIAKHSVPNLKLIVSGDHSGAYGSMVAEYCRTSSFAADIRVLGRTSDAQKRELMERCHVIAVTSVKEGWGLIVTEAASQGTPAVVYDVDGLCDAVQDGRTGIVTRTNTPAALAEAVVKLLSDSERYAEYRRQGWQWSKELTFERSYAELIAALDLRPEGDPVRPSAGQGSFRM
jgi:glycosyltransferase involved in cell wall biosynthesis